MTSDLKILVLEDDQNDADLLHRELRKSGFNFTSKIVQAREEYEYALEHFGPDIILSDYSLPAFDAISAFRIKQNTSPDIPFIIVSGIIGEENAVDLIKNGITDYALKDKLFTLSQKITRALKDAEDGKEKINITEKLKLQAAELVSANRELYEKALLLEQQEKKLIRTNEDLIRLNQHLENRVFERTGELEKLIHDLKDLSLSKDKLLAVISHDLRNPLAVILLASEELSFESENTVFDSIQPFVKIIRRSSLNILQQLDELLSWAKSQQDKAVLNVVKINLADAVNLSFELLKSNAVRKRILFDNIVDPNVYVTADALMLRSILQNLVTNSIKYSFEGGQIIVSAKQVDRLIEICIADSGIGMDDYTIENLFSKSDQTSVLGTRNETGFGLGLVLVKDFVSQNGGTIRLESEVKKGTQIYFTLALSV
jgi:two-component system, sensor histidine kinase and response regulator